MSSVSTDYGSQSLQVAMMKKASDQEGRVAMSILQGAVQTAQATSSMHMESSHPVVHSSSSPAPVSASDHVVDTYA